jgi:hypothetical protein
VTCVSSAANKVGPADTNTDGMKRRTADIKNKAVASTTQAQLSEKDGNQSVSKAN